MNTGLRTLIVAVAAGGLAACAALSRDFDDGGRAQRMLEEAPVDAPVDQTLGEPTLQVVERRFGDTQDPVREGPDESPNAAQSCNAGEWAALVGRPLRSIDQRLLPEPYRVICDGCLASQEFKYNRLNIYLRADGTIDRFVCG